MDYKIFKNSLTPHECQDFIDFGKSQYAGLKADQIYPNRYYPGFTLLDASSILNRLKNFIDIFDINITYDLGPGAGINYINAQIGEGIGPHIDKPLYEFDENIQVLPEYNNRACSATVLACLQGSNEFNIEGQDITIETGDVIVLRGFTVHEMKPVNTDIFYLLSAFYCTDINF